MIQSKIEIRGSRTHRVVFFPKVGRQQNLAAFACERRKNNMLMVRVFNTDEKQYFGTITKAAEAALNENFRLFLFNDIVYLITQNESYYDTGLRKNNCIVSSD